MTSSAFHQCQHCGYETDVSTSLSIFEADPHCRQCGLSASESDLKMQDELANLMTRNLHLNNATVEQPFNTSNPPTPQITPHAPPITYITQHYHHSAHQAPHPPQNDVECSQALAAAGIDSSALLPSQFHLFKHAPTDQQQRLIELWRIAPPKYDKQMLMKNLQDWPQTNMQHEEEAARQRWEMMSNQEREMNMNHYEARNNAEPYMTDGYAGLPNINGLVAPTEYGGQHKMELPRATEYNRAHDPVYQSREWWQHVSETQPMEHQYGALQQMRIHDFGSGGMDEDEEML